MIDNLLLLLSQNFDKSIISITVYLSCLIFIVFERIDKTIIAIGGALILILLGVFDVKEAINYIDFETILLLMGMMMIMHICHKSEIFSWLSTKIAALTKGNPFLIFLVFLFVTAVFSAFFDNVTTILIIVPITLAITKGMGINPKLFIVSEIIFSNIGGALTLIGDPPNIIIGSKVGLSFNTFIYNMGLPVILSIITIYLVLVLFNWKEIKPIKTNLSKLFLSYLLIKKIQLQFSKKVLKKRFIYITLLILILSILGFVYAHSLNISVGVLSMLAATVLLIFTTKEVDLNETLNKVEWPTLFFFAGLFIITGSLEKTGVLAYFSHGIISITDNFTYLLILVLWVSGIVSMLVDNIPFVTIMIPIIYDIQEVFSGNPHVSLLWWALALGACLGGNGTLIGASANVVGVSLASKEGVNITFLDYMKMAFPLTFITLVISSIYLLIRLTY